MNSYVITKFMSKLGYAFGLLVIAVATVAGAGAMKGFLGGVCGALVGIVVCFPTMLICELAMAVVKIEENTRGKGQQGLSAVPPSSENSRHAA